MSERGVHQESSADDFLFDSPGLEELVDSELLTQLASSLLRLFGLPVRIFSADAVLLTEASTDVALYRYLESFPKGRVELGRTIDAIKRTWPEGEPFHDLHCFTGVLYRIIALEHDGRRVGRVVIGPYLPLEATSIPPSLLAIEGVTLPELNAVRGKIPRVGAQTVMLISEHIRSTLDVVLFSGYKAHVTSRMHLASVRESFRELQEKNHQLQESFDKLRELDRLKSNFLATVSHELRTPLTSIIGYGDMLLEGFAGPLQGEQQEYITIIREKGEQLLQLIMSLLDMSKLESGTLSFRKGAVSIAHVLQQVSSTILPAARRKGLSVEVRVDKDLPQIAGDEERLRQVFLNISENALKFTPKGGIISLEASLAEPEDMEGFALLAPASDRVEVRVADSGIGIPESERSKVFDPFYQVDSSSTREQGGAGLGLSIVKRIIEAHHGTIHIEARAPQGTIFVIRLPSVVTE